MWGRGVTGWWGVREETRDRYIQNRENTVHMIVRGLRSSLSYPSCTGEDDGDWVTRRGVSHDLYRLQDRSLVVGTRVSLRLRVGHPWESWEPSGVEEVIGPEGIGRRTRPQSGDPTSGRSTILDLWKGPVSSDVTPLHDLHSPRPEGGIPMESSSSLL